MVSMPCYTCMCIKWSAQSSLICRYILMIFDKRFISIGHWLDCLFVWICSDMFMLVYCLSLFLCVLMFFSSVCAQRINSYKVLGSHSHLVAEWMKSIEIEMEKIRGFTHHCIQRGIVQAMFFHERDCLMWFLAIGAFVVVILLHVTSNLLLFSFSSRYRRRV